MRDVGACPVQHCDDEVLGDLEMRAAAVLWMRRRERRSKWEVKSRTSARCAVLRGQA
jgi:hypothetical protein